MSGGLGGSVARKESAGFTLLEVVVALAILVGSMTFVFSLFLSRQKSFREQEAIARTQRNLQTGMAFVERDLRRAGYGFPPGFATRLSPGMTGGPSVLLVSGLGVADGGTSASDNLYVAHLSSAPTRLALEKERSTPELQLMNASGWRAGDIGVLFDAHDADMFRVSRVGSEGRLAISSEGPFDKGMSKTYRRGSLAARVAFAGYFVGPDGVGGKRALFRTGVDSTGMPVSRVVSENIEEMQVRLLLPDGGEQDGDGTAWDPETLARAIAVRISLAARGRTAGRGADDGRFRKGSETNRVSFAPHREHERRTMEAWFDLRNRGIEP